MISNKLGGFNNDFERFTRLGKQGEKREREKERVKAAQKLAVGMGVVAAAGGATGIIFAPKSGKETREDLKKEAINSVETIKDTVQKKAATVKDSTAHASQELCKKYVMSSKKFMKKGQAVKNDIKDSYHEITQDIHKTAENISDEFNEFVK